MHACKFLCPGMWLFLAMPRERVFPVMAYTGRLRPKFSPRSKRFQSSYCAKVRAGAKKTVEGGGGGEKRKRLPVNPTILENAPWYFTARFTCELTARQNRSITNRLPLDHQISKITLNFSLIEHVPGDCKNCNKNVYDKRRFKTLSDCCGIACFLLYGFISSETLSKSQKWFVRNNSLRRLF